MKISLVIATHARPDSLARLLQSLAPQLLDRGGAAAREILLAENGTPERSLLPATAPPLQHLHDARPGKCRVQNAAIRRAAGEIIACLDDDLVAAPDYLDQVERFFAEHPEFAAMKGRILPAEDPALKLGAEAAPWLDLPIVDHGEETVEVRGVLGANMAFRASALARVGLFDERLGPGAAGHEEETEMSLRLRRAGFRIGYAPRALVYHDVDPARADRARFLRIARERGRCRMLHESHGAAELMANHAVAALRVWVARLVGARPERMAREERRLAVAQGMLEARRPARRATS
ncbi:MAG TPA: glycosyltransferase [Candidatus Binataceae bacterium]|nr:glycosyltransferase [Candidatus Binataceae bacterium]